MAYADAHPDVGVLGCQVLEDAERVQQTCFRFPSPLHTLLFATGLSGRFPRSRLAGRASYGPWDRTTEREVDVVSGMFMLVSREAIDDAGPMDEDYFVYAEETDWCFQIARAGWRVVHVPDARVIHIFGASTKKKVPAETRIEYHKSLYRFFRKNRGSFPALLILILRSLKAILYVLWGIPGALAHGRRRDRWLQDCKVLRWHVRGCPDDEGLAGLREKSPDGGGT